MLRDEFERLSQLFDQGAEGKAIDIEEVFKQSLEFFSHLKKQIEIGTPEEKQEAVDMMTALYDCMMDATKKICKTSGLSEEQLLTYAENPANFSPDQWRALQESKNKIAHAGRGIAKAIHEQSHAGPSSTTPSHGAHLEKKRGSPMRKSKRSEWLRS